MNVIPFTRFRPKPTDDEISAFVSLARRLNRQALNYSMWSRQADALDQIETYRKYRVMATEYHANARWYLSCARLRRDQQEAANG